MKKAQVRLQTLMAEVENTQRVIDDYHSSSTVGWLYRRVMGSLPDIEALRAQNKTRTDEFRRLKQRPADDVDELREELANVSSQLTQAQEQKLILESKDALLKKADSVNEVLIELLRKYADDSNPDFHGYFEALDGLNARFESLQQEVRQQLYHEDKQRSDFFTTANEPLVEARVRFLGSYQEFRQRLYDDFVDCLPENRNEQAAKALEAFAQEHNVEKLLRHLMTLPDDENIRDMITDVKRVFAGIQPEALTSKM